MNIVLIVLDTARGDITNSLIEDGELPNLAALAKNGQWYTDARANGPWTVPSHGSIFTGEYPSESGITGDDPTYYNVPLVEELSSKGYATAGYSANPWLSAEFNFNSAFDVFHNKFDYDPNGISISHLFRESTNPSDLLMTFFSEIRDKPVASSLINLLFWAYQRSRRKDSGGKYLLSRAADRLVKDPERDDFIFVNVTEPHLAYSVPDEWLPKDITKSDLNNIEQDPAQYNANISDISEDEFGILRDTYRSTLKYVDHQLEQLIKKASDNTTIIVAGDHGELLGEHNRFGHQYSLHRELLHVPLVINGPTIEPKKVTETVELKSLCEIILGLAENETRRLPEQPYHIAETISPRPSLATLKQKDGSSPGEYVYMYNHGARSITSDRGKLIEFPDGDVKFINEDGSEATASQELRESLHSTLANECGEIISGRDTDLKVSEDIKSQLKDLGYA
ncbi:sulfatase [Haloferax namakaokahaiae]|uniref:Sulfatase n=1 Tax=Haloferax namakaokahaiae TaxID=1748331 RepID=A0ABD5ZC66_9EURY